MVATTTTVTDRIMNRAESYVIVERQGQDAESKSASDDRFETRVHFAWRWIQQRHVRSPHVVGLRTHRLTLSL